MPATPAKSRKSVLAHDWVFRWRPEKSPIFPKLAATAVAGAAFAVLVTQVRIQLKVPEKSAPRKASVIYLGDDETSRALRIRAQDGGPLPTRFDPRQWAGLEDVERAALDAASFRAPAHVPAIAELPEDPLILPLELAAKGRRFFPAHPPVTPPAAPLPAVLAPVLYPLAGVAAASLPRDLPPLATTSEMASAAWRFVIRLDEDGTALDILSMEKGDAPAAKALAAWLRRIRFAPPPANRPAWIAIAIGFANQPAHGPDTQ